MPSNVSPRKRPSGNAAPNLLTQALSSGTVSQRAEKKRKRPSGNDDSSSELPDLNRGAVMSGHFKGAVWGLATHPTEQECVTVGDDATVRVFDLVDAKLVMQAELDCPMRCVSYSPDAKYIAVGMGMAALGGATTFSQ